MRPIGQNNPPKAVNEYRNLLAKAVDGYRNLLGLIAQTLDSTDLDSTDLDSTDIVLSRHSFLQTYAVVV
jgi:hypothetical protein